MTHTRAEGYVDNYGRGGLSVRALLQRARRESCGIADPLTAGFPGPEHNAARMHREAMRPDWEKSRQTLQLAEAHLCISSQPPACTRYHGLTRTLARFVARLVLFLAKVVTQRQQTYNAAALNALVESHQELQALEERVHHLECELGSQIRQLDFLRQELQGRPAPPIVPARAAA